MEATRNCLICTATITIGHAGIDACRACASFYKRTALSGQQYPCRQGKGECSYRKHQRFTCRSCRFRKCADLGMLLDPLGSGVSSNSVTPPPPVITASPEEHVVQTMARVSPRHEEGVLDKILKTYRESCDRRKTQELRFVKLFDLSKSAHPNEEYFISSVRHSFESYRVLVTESLSIIRTVYPNIHEFPIESKIALFKCFIKFSVVESYYLTQRDWRNTTYFVVSLITCSDLSNSSEWVTDADNVQRKEDLVRFLDRYTAEYSNFLISIRKSEDISEIEYAAIIALSFCTLGMYYETQNVPETLLLEADALRAAVFSELHRYYREELRLVNYSGKIGRLMTMFHTMSEASTMLAEELRMYSYLFGVYASDILVRDVFIQ